MNKITCLSLFSCAGMAETYFKEVGFNVVLANELLKDRCDFYKYLYPETEILHGDIKDNKLRSVLIKKALQYKVDFIIATPPCQGMSRHGKRDLNDQRNQLIYYAIDVILKVRPKFILLENVPKQLSTYINYKNNKILIPDYIKLKLKKLYNINEDTIFNSADYGVPQTRKRSIFCMSDKSINATWKRPVPDKDTIPLEKAIGHLPSLDPNIREEGKRFFFPKYEIKRNKGLLVSKWHYPPVHSWNHVKWMSHTPSGKSAFENKIFYPKKKDGKKINGRISTYKRYSWSKPANTLTQNNGVISSAICVHPGRLIKENLKGNYTYSDARVLSIYELLIVSPLPLNWNIPDWANDKMIRNVIGEGIPPLLIKKIVKQIKY